MSRPLDFLDSVQIVAGVVMSLLGTPVIAKDYYLL